MGVCSTFGLPPVAIASLRQLLGWGVPDIYRTLSDRAGTIAARAAELGVGSVLADRRAGHYLGLRFPAGVPAVLPGRLADAKVYASVRGSALRVTPHLWNTDEDVERLIEVLK